jgi:hypothetical protein
MEVGAMHYILVFLGLIGVAVILAMSPLVPRLLEYFFSQSESDGPMAKAASPHAIERSEMRDEIRRLTAELETDRRASARMKGLQ